MPEPRKFHLHSAQLLRIVVVGHDGGSHAGDQMPVGRAEVPTAADQVGGRRGKQRAHAEMGEVVSAVHGVASAGYEVLAVELSEFDDVDLASGLDFWVSVSERIRREVARPKVAE